MTAYAPWSALLIFLCVCVLTDTFPRVRLYPPAINIKNDLSRQTQYEDESEVREDFSQTYPNIDWWKAGQEELTRVNTRQQNLNTHVAKNVIFFVGDGMGISTESAARVLLAERQPLTKDKNPLSWQNFPHVGMQRTYNLDRQVTDSAASATAMLCGIKARHRTLGMKADITIKNCSSGIGKEADSILHYSHKEGKWAGVVTTTSVTHATPAASYAHTTYRNWESDENIPPEDRDLCFDIAKQLVYNNSEIKVILGGGRRHFYPNGTKDIEYPEQSDARGRRVDGKNLVEDWLNMKKDKIAKFVWNETEFSNVDPSKTDYLMGLFEPYHMQYEYDRRKPTNEAKEPSLADMTEKAIKMLERSPKGFFLLVEGGRIDHAHHDNNAARALIDTIALHEAVERANKLTKEEDTLIVVTADHSHVFTYAGYPSFHNPILGISDKDQGADGMPFAVLGYYNGPGFFPNLRKDWQNLTQDVQSPRKRVSNNDTMNHEYVQPAAVPLRSETHAGEDVGIYARGPMSHLFARNHENIYLAHAMMFASCVGPNQDHCKVLPTPKPTNSGSVGQIANVANLFLYICAIFIILLRR